MNAREELLERIFERNRDRVLCVDARTGVATTYGGFQHDSRVLASALASRGATAENPVAVSLGNAVETALIYFACLHLGARIVPINPAYHPKDVRELLHAISPGLFIVTPHLLGAVRSAGKLPARTRVICTAPGKPVGDLVDFSVPDELRQNEPLGGPRLTPDVFMTMFTSGSTGKPKGINFTYDRVVGNARSFAARIGLGREHRFFDVLPMTYLGGFYNLFLIPLLVEGSVVVDDVFGMATLYGFWERVRRFGIDALWFNPTMMSQLLALEDDDDLSFLRAQVKVALCGMAALPVDLKRRFEERFGFLVHENYGLSETLFLTTNHPGLVYKPGSVGLPLEGVEIALVNERGEPVATGREGQVRVKTPHLTDRYVSSSGADNVNFLPDGSFLTGDIATRDESGEVFIRGRVKDVIIRGGINIYPKAIESVIYSLEGVEEAAVVGLPHPVYGEEVALVVKTRRGASLSHEDLRAFCDRSIANFQRPRYLYFIDDFPRGVTGKLQKTVLKRLLEQRLDPIGLL